MNGRCGYKNCWNRALYTGYMPDVEPGTLKLYAKRFARCLKHSPKRIDTFDSEEECLAHITTITLTQGLYDG